LYGIKSCYATIFFLSLLTINVGKVLQKSVFAKNKNTGLENIFLVEIQIFQVEFSRCPYATDATLWKDK
jgi:hypothetical protein